MQHIHRSALFFAVLAATGGSLIAKEPNKAATPAPAQAKATPLAFAKGGDHAEIKGRFKAPKDFAHEYAIDLKGGQTYSVRIEGDKDHIIYFNVFAPGALHREGEGRSRQDVRASKDGTYTIHVFMTRTAVDKGAASTWTLAVDRKP